MGTRTELSNLLSAVDEVNGNIYFQPPVNLVMKYPCIVYTLNGENAQHADDLIYRRKRQYTVTVIDRDPDSAIPDRVAELLKARMDRHFVSDHLHHFVYLIYF